MKPFDLEAAKAGKPIVNRAGGDVTFVASTHNTSIEKIIYVDNEDVRVVNHDGRRFTDEDSNYDLFMKSEKKKFWVAIYFSNSGYAYCIHNQYLTKDELDAAMTAWQPTLKYYPVEVEIDV